MKGSIFFLISIALLMVSAGQATAQNKEVYRGTVVFYGSGHDLRTGTRPFTLTLNSLTSDADASQFIQTLSSDGQDELLNAIDKRTVGRFSVGNNVGIDVNVARERMVDGKMRVFVAFKRWTEFAELRYGLRSLDYPFGVIEIYIDPATGKGEGTYIAAAKVSWGHDKKTNADQIEIENFATWPAKLMNVSRSGEIKP